MGFTARRPASSIFQFLTINFEIRILLFRSTIDRAMWVSNELHHSIVTANWRVRIGMKLMPHIPGRWSQKHHADPRRRPHPTIYLREPRNSHMLLLWSVECMEHCTCGEKSRPQCHNNLIANNLNDRLSLEVAEISYVNMLSTATAQQHSTVLQRHWFIQRFYQTNSQR